MEHFLISHPLISWWLQACSTLSEVVLLGLGEESVSLGCLLLLDGGTGNLVLGFLFMFDRESKISCCPKIPNQFTFFLAPFRVLPWLAFMSFPGLRDVFIQGIVGINGFMLFFYFQPEILYLVLVSGAYPGMLADYSWICAQRCLLDTMQCWRPTCASSFSVCSQTWRHLRPSTFDGSREWVTLEGTQGRFLALSLGLTPGIAGDCYRLGDMQDNCLNPCTILSFLLH